MNSGQYHRQTENGAACTFPFYTAVLLPGGSVCLFLFIPEYRGIPAGAALAAGLRRFVGGNLKRLRQAASGQGGQSGIRHFVFRRRDLCRRGDRIFLPVFRDDVAVGFPLCLRRVGLFFRSAELPHRLVAGTGGAGGAGRRIPCPGRSGAGRIDARYL